VVYAVVKPKRYFLCENPDPLTVLVAIVLRKRSHVVKPRDALKLGIDDHSLITLLGIILGRLVRAGLARVLNNAKPRRYLIESWVADWIVTYEFRCFRGLHCPYVRECPIRKALKEVVKRED